MIITHHREKLINAVLYFAKSTKYCGKTKLMKLLFFLDFMHFKQTGKSVTGLNYYAWSMGPVPKAFFEEISGPQLPKDLKNVVSIKQAESFQEIVARKKPDMDYFSPREAKIMEDICFVYKNVQADDISEISHLPNQPWDRTKREKGLKKQIDYLFALDDSSDSLPYEVAKERHIEIQEMYTNYGVV